LCESFVEVAYWLLPFSAMAEQRIEHFCMILCALQYQFKTKQKE